MLGSRTVRKALLESHGHSHWHPSLELKDLDLDGSPGRRVMVYAMEGSIGIHSVLIGLGLGVMHAHFMQVVTLTVALVFHQFFEGVALGTAAVKAQFQSNAARAKFLIFIFTVSCPLGVVLGIFLFKHLQLADPSTAWTLGILNALAAGTLIHIGFVELLAEDFSEEGGRKHRSVIPFVVVRLVALFCGGLVMSLLAIWA